LNVADAEVDRDAPLCIGPEAARHWLAVAGVVGVRPPTSGTVVRSHVLIVLAGVYDVVGEDEETRKVEPVRGRATDPRAVAPALVEVKARVRGGLAMCIVAFSGCGAGAPRRKFWGYVITFN